MPSSNHSYVSDQRGYNMFFYDQGFTWWHSTNDAAYSSARRNRSRSWTNQGGQRPYRRTQGYTDIQTVCRQEPFNFDLLEYGRPYIRYSGFMSPIGFEEKLSSACALPSTNAVKLKLLNETLKDASWDVPVFLGEVNETVEMIYGTAKRLASAYNNVKRKRYKKALKDLGLSKPSGNRDNWMSYRYGWGPAIADCQSAARSAAWAVTQSPPEISVRAAIHHGTKTTVFRGDLSSSGCSWGTGPSMRHSSVMEVSQISHAWLHLRVKNPALIALENFGFLNFPSTLWELTKLSFMVDWVVDIGSYLKAQTALVGYEVLDGGVSALSSGFLDATATGSTDGPFRGIFPRTHLTYRQYQRSPWSGSMPVIPSWDPKINWKRLVDATALLSSVFESSSKR